MKIYEEKLSAEERKDLNDSQFGIPELRMFPLNDENHVRMAISMFKKCPKGYEKELATNIMKASKKFNIEVKNEEILKYANMDNLDEGKLIDTALNVRDIGKTSKMNEKYLKLEKCNLVKFKQIIEKQITVANSAYNKLISRVKDKEDKENIKKYQEKCIEKYKKVIKQVEEKLSSKDSTTVYIHVNTDFPRYIRTKEHVNIIQAFAQTGFRPYFSWYWQGGLKEKNMDDFVRIAGYESKYRFMITK